VGDALSAVAEDALGEEEVAPGSSTAAVVLEEKQAVPDISGAAAVIGEADAISSGVPVV
jgi:hypothetical protein